MTEAVDDLSAAVFERAALDATHLRAMHDALRWTRQHRLFEGHAATATRACVNAATYARLCAPPRASARQLELATTFTVLFFWLDDLEPAALAEVIAGRWSQVPALADWRADADELDRCGPALAATWAEALRTYLAALADELAIDPATITLAEQHELRRRNAFIDPYLDLWVALLDVEPPSQLAGECARARWIARELIVLANDLGSLARDLAADAERPELNLVITAARERGCSHAEASAALVEQHNGLVGELSTLLAVITAGGAVAGRVHAELLREVVIGNVAAMRALAERYGGAAQLLDALAVPR